MSSVVILHNPNCSTSKYAVGVAEEMGVDHEVVKYMLKANHLGPEQLADLLAKLEDPPTDLVRRDANFAKLGLTDDDVRTREQVVEVLTAHPTLLQRPVLIRDGRAIIGRPKDRVAAFLGS
jgi:arsenate reductase (glutaredoxin)